MSQETKTYQENELDLRELWQTISKRKALIGAITLSITVCATIYAYIIKQPIYEVKALIEIGDYRADNNNNNNNNRILLDNASQLEKKISTVFIDIVKEDENKEYEISSVSMPKGLTNFLEITSEALSNEKAIDGIQKIVSFMQTDHQKILDDVKKRRELELKNIDFQISDIKEKTVSLLDKKIELQKNNLEDLRAQLMSINENLKNLQSLNPSLAALKLMEKRDMSNAIISVTTQLFDMESQKNELLTTRIYKLEESKKILEALLLSHNYKNTLIVGEIIKQKGPSKPKKSLIVGVSFVSGLILSVFLVFFLEFIGKKNDE